MEQQMMLREIIHNKLVRDKIPDILNEKGIPFVVRKLSASEYAEALVAKLQEEVREFTRAFPGEDCREELADIREVLRDLELVLPLNARNSVELMHEKRQQRGGFSKRLLLVSTKEEVPRITLEGIGPLIMSTLNGLRLFEVRLNFSDGSRRLWEMTLGQLHKLGATEVKTLNHTRKLKDWIMGAGKPWFEAQVNKEDMK